jgi:ATP-dependent DNA helicase RecG
MSANPATQPLPPLARPVTALLGVGRERAAQLARLHISTVEDLLLHRPRRYEDRSHFRPIAELVLDEPAITRGKVLAQGLKWFARRSKSIFEFILDDGTARLHCRWWNLPFMEKYFAVGDEVVVFGKPNKLKPRTMDHPETEVVETGEENFIHLNRITPVYPLTEGLPQRWLRSLIWRTLEQLGPQIPELWPELAAPAFKYSPAIGSLPGRATAIRWLHFPDEIDQVESARKRLALDELIVLQGGILARRRNFETRAHALPCRGDNRFMRPFLAALGFKLTEAQTRVLRELRHDMSGPHPMRRLLQGDVGSGKTAVAACCALMALESGFNVALMAPTEILAEQHFRRFSEWFGPLGIPVEIQTGSHKSAQGSSPARATLFVGTHALIQSGFDPGNLGLVIIDEQHKFGVAQREELLRKGRYPHLLVMTATPIPRTLGLTLYGELDSSVIDQLPPGRGRVRTFLRPAEKLGAVHEFIRSKLKEGRQVYVVYPRIEESQGIKAVTREFERLKRELAPFKVGLLHGRMKSAEKEVVMDAFRENTIQVLTATSLIEVGVDVPNATVMLVENAEQFGLAQLHQLRGRIGRGAHESFCVLVSSAKNEDASRRLRILADSNDGFQIAEEDLKIRGPGELLGRQQSGEPELRFGDLKTDWPLILEARRLAAEFAGNQPTGNPNG